jgi:hypothetical protein
LQVTRQARLHPFKKFDNQAINQPGSSLKSGKFNLYSSTARRQFLPPSELFLLHPPRHPASPSISAHPATIQQQRSLFTASVITSCDQSIGVVRLGHQHAVLQTVNIAGSLKLWAIQSICKLRCQ